MAGIHKATNPLSLNPHYTSRENSNDFTLHPSIAAMARKFPSIDTSPRAKDQTSHLILLNIFA